MKHRRPFSSISSGLVKAVAGAALVGLSAGVHAFTVTASVSSTPDRSHTTTTSLDLSGVNGNTSFLSSSLTGYAGRLQTRITQGANATTDSFLGDATDQSLVWTWCIEPQDYINTPTDVYEVSALEQSNFRQFGTSVGAQRQADVAALFGSLIDTDTGRVFSTADDDSLNLGNRDRMTAFQLALWEIVQEATSDYDLADGAFTLQGVGGVSNDADILAQANQWLASLGTPLQARDDLAFWVLDTTANGGTGGQSQIAISIVPLPAGIWLFGSAMALLCSFGRRSGRRLHSA